MLDLTQRTLTTFGFDRYELNLSTRPPKSVGSDAVWAKAEAALRAALDAKGWPYKVDEGGGAFYGPKARAPRGLDTCLPSSCVVVCLFLTFPASLSLPPPDPQIDLKIKDAIGRKWQCSTVQVDFNLPERFDMAYTDEHGERVRPIMIHRALLGSLERFFGVLIEHHAGAFPLWLAPVQVRLLPVSDDFAAYTAECAAALRAAGLRVEVMSRASMSKMIRTAEKAKTPVMAVIGAREVEARALTVRTHGGHELGALPLAEVVERAARASRERSGAF